MSRRKRPALLFACIDAFRLPEYAAKTMTIVTSLLADYRRRASALWNARVRELGGRIAEWDDMDELDDRCVAMFRRCVLDRIEASLPDMLPDYESQRSPVPRLAVVPHDGVQVQIGGLGGDDGPSGFLDPALLPASAFRFLGLFDFECRESRSFEFCRVRIAACPDDSAISRDGLIPFDDCAFVLTDDDATAGTPLRDWLRAAEASLSLPRDRGGPTRIVLPPSLQAVSRARVVLLLYAIFLFSIAVWRPWAAPVPPFSRAWDLVPFTGLGNLWRAGLVPFTFLFVGNIACFVPFGFGIPALTPLRRAVIPLCFLGSLLIECLQWAFGTGMGQTEDLILNTLGGAIGYGLFRRSAYSVEAAP